MSGSLGAAWATRRTGCAPSGTGRRFSVQVLRQMRKTDGNEPRFGEDFLWVLLAEKLDG
jgi:hypothetical protein